MEGNKIVKYIKLAETRKERKKNIEYCTQYASKSGHRTEKGQFSFPSQRKAMPKNAQTTTQLHSFHTLAK